MLKSMARPQGWVLLSTAHTEPQLPPNPLSLQELLLAFLCPTSSKAWKWRMENSNDLRLRSSVKFVLEQDFRCECWALVGLFQSAWRQAYGSLSNACRKHCFRPETYSGVVVPAAMNWEPGTPGAQMCCPPSLPHQLSPSAAVVRDL